MPRSFEQAFREHGAVDVVCAPCDKWLGMLNLRRHTPEAAAMLPPIDPSTSKTDMVTALQNVKKALGESAYVPVASLIGEFAPFSCPKCRARFQIANVDGEVALKRVPLSH